MQLMQIKMMVAMIGMAASVSLISVNALAEAASAANQPTEGAPAMSQDQKNKMQGEAFLAENKKKPGVVTLPSGLQYQVVVAGKGEKPADQDMVTVNYEGKLIDGTVFDSSYKRGEPATFPVSGVIPGWVEALKLMNAGSTWMLFIPAELAYCEMGAPPAIGPNETLIFKVDLIEIKK